MFTQCPKCETIFKLSAEVLRAAAGEVRCGRCGEIFNALSSLAEEPRAFSKGESPREQETRADNILRFVPAEPPAKRVAPDDLDFSGRPGTQIAHLEFQDPPNDELPWSLDEEEAADAGDTHADRDADIDPDADIGDDASLEFTLPPGELDRIFIEARPRAVPRPPGSSQGAVEEFEPSRPADIRNDLSDSLIESLAATDETVLPVDSAKPLEIETPAWPLAPASMPDTAAPMAVEAAATAATAAVTTTAPVAPHPESLARIQPEPQWVIDETPASKPRKALWVVAAAASALLLLVQIVHQNRDMLAQTAGIGPTLRSIYDALGRPIPVQINLTAFEVRQWGVTGDASANGTLRVRASVINTGERPQPYPLLRLTLADRFGTRIGSRDFLPKEYLKRDPARALEPRERADAIVEIVDPGKTAEGFEIDVCARAADGRIACANDAVRAKS